jgi:hypothetical protein
MASSRDELVAKLWVGPFNLRGEIFHQGDYRADLFVQLPDRLLGFAQLRGSELFETPSNFLRAYSWHLGRRRRRLMIS